MNLCFLIFVSIYFAVLNATNYNYSIIKSLIEALSKDVTFIAERINQMNDDSMLGLIFTEENLNSTLMSEEINFFHDKTLKIKIGEIVEMCQFIKAQFKHKYYSNGSENPSNPLMKKILIDWNFQPRRINWRRGVLKFPSINSNLTDEYLIGLIFHGTPSESQSNYCLTELSKNNCEIRESCNEILLDANGSSGYSLTHRLLIIQLAELLECKKSRRINYKKLKEDYCERIWKDLLELEAGGFPSISQDLAMEQIVVCGKEGHLEFTNLHYSELLISWPNFAGCYSVFGMNRFKRSTRKMEFGCDSHASGVAAAALSLQLRSLIQSNNHIKFSYS